MCLHFICQQQRQAEAMFGGSGGGDGFNQQQQQPGATAGVDQLQRAYNLARNSMMAADDLRQKL